MNIELFGFEHSAPTLGVSILDVGDPRINHFPLTVANTKGAATGLCPSVKCLEFPMGICGRNHKGKAPMPIDRPERWCGPRVIVS